MLSADVIVVFIVIIVDVTGCVTVTVDCDAVIFGSNVFFQVESIIVVLKIIQTGQQLPDISGVKGTQVS